MTSWSRITANHIDPKDQMRDFTLQTYKILCTELQRHGYSFVTFAEYCEQIPSEKFVIMRHDIDRNPENALKIAHIENRLMVSSSYYFRIVKRSYDEAVMNEIASLGHEIGYHYEDLTVAGGDTDYAIKLFTTNLKIMRKIYPVRTICMHGSPLSRWDNLMLWKKYNYRDYGIVGEPYIDVDFSKVTYLTDTGRCWNGKNVSVRDKVESTYRRAIKTTFDLIEQLNYNLLPDQLMITMHPQRWANESLPWLRELVWQNTKNVVKRYFLVK